MPESCYSIRIPELHKSQTEKADTNTKHNQIILFTYLVWPGFWIVKELLRLCEDERVCQYHEVDGFYAGLLGIGGIVLVGQCCCTGPLGTFQEMSLSVPLQVTKLQESLATLCTLEQMKPICDMQHKNTTKLYPAAHLPSCI